MVWSSPRTFVTGETVTAAHLNQEIRDNLNAGFPNAVSSVSWSPTLSASTTNPTVASVTGRYWRVGPLVYAAAQFAFDASADGGSGIYSTTLPIASSGVSVGSSGQAIGSVYLYNDNTPANRQPGTAFLVGASTVRFVSANGGWVSDANPFTWANGDVLTFQAIYPAA